MNAGPGEPAVDLLARFRAGEAAAFDQLVFLLGPRLKGYFLRQGAGEATAEDLTQNVFLRAYQQAGRYHEEGRLPAYFLRIARNLWIDHCRRQRGGGAQDSSAGLEDAPADDPGPEQRAAAADRAALLRAALAALDPEGREILELAVVQALPYRDVAAVLEIPVGTVKSRVFYALCRLRARLAGSTLADEAGETVRSEA